MRCIVFLVFFLVSFTVKAQENNDSLKKGLTIGVQLLPGVAAIYNLESFSKLQGERFSFNGGIGFTKVIKNELIYLQSGIFLFNRGMGGRTDITGEQGNIIRNLKFSYNFYYLQLPLMVNIKKKNFYAGAGPAFNYRVAGRFIMTGK